MEVYKRIKSYIIDLGLKQGKVAEKAGYDAKKFSAMMNGKRKIYAEDLAKICSALDVSPEQFIPHKKLA